MLTSGYQSSWVGAGIPWYAQYPNVPGPFVCVANVVSASARCHVRGSVSGNAPAGWQSCACPTLYRTLPMGAVLYVSPWQSLIQLTVPSTGLIDARPSSPPGFATFWKLKPPRKILEPFVERLVMPEFTPSSWIG